MIKINSTIGDMKCDIQTDSVAEAAQILSILSKGGSVVSAPASAVHAVAQDLLPGFTKKDVETRHKKSIPGLLKCKFCGVAFKSDRHRLFCSDDCRWKFYYRKRKLRKRRQMRIENAQKYPCKCKICGIDFESRKPGSEFCSPTCQLKWSRSFIRRTAPEAHVPGSN